MAWLHDRGELGLGEVFTHRKVDKELACFQLIVNSTEKAIKYLIILFHRSVLGTEFRGELEDALLITEVGINIL